MCTVQSIEEEIKAAKITFEEELLKIETKINQNSYEDDGEEEDEQKTIQVTIFKDMAATIRGKVAK